MNRNKRTELPIKKKQPFDFDFDDVFAAANETPPPEIVILKSSDRRRPGKVTAKGYSDYDDDGFSVFEMEDEYEKDRERDWDWGRVSEKGGKYKSRLCQLDHGASRSKKPANSGSSRLDDGPKRPKSSFQHTGQSTFADCHWKKLKGDVQPASEPNTSKQSHGAFDPEILSLNMFDKRKRKPSREPSPVRQSKPKLVANKAAARNPFHRPHDSGKLKSSNELSDRASTYGPLYLTTKRVSATFTKSGASPTLHSEDSENEKDVDLVVEVEPDLTEQKRGAELPPSRACSDKIYYPSRDHPESMEIFSSELKCLEPGEYLTSTIMNFYIRFLEGLCSSMDSLRRNCYFFNTYFYSKLQKTAGNQKEALFNKFRRWWRGVNMFEKSYIFLPINDARHWSLVIICIPDEEDKSGPIILHLDSLGLHSSCSIFDNIRSFLTSEWAHINGDDGASEVLIQDRIWEDLPCRIDEKIITAPRQTNDYDCGIFVLYYMERFLKDAPDRMKSQDLTMFDKNWFKPEEASSLRGKIKEMLQEKFLEAATEDSPVRQAVCLSANTDAAKALNLIEVS